MSAKIKNIVIRKPQWYRMVDFFDGPAKAVTRVNEADVLLQGVLYEADFPCPKCGAKVHLDKINLKENDNADLSPQLGLCLIPQEAVGNQQGEALRRMLEANLRMPVLLISNNVQMVRLKPIMQGEADRILEGAGEDGKAEGKLLAIPGGNREAEQRGGQGTRAGDRVGPPEDPGAEPMDSDPGERREGKGPADEGAAVGGGEGAQQAPETQRDSAG